MTTIKFSDTINRPAEEIFDLLADIRRNPEWCPGFTAAEKLTPGPVGPDAQFTTIMRGMGGLQIRITAYERPRQLWFGATANQMEMGHNFTFVHWQWHAGGSADRRPPEGSVAVGRSGRPDRLPTR